MSNSGNRSRTNWERVDSLTEEAIDTSDIPLITEAQMARSKWFDPERLDEMQPEYDLASLKVRRLGPGRKSFKPIQTLQTEKQ